MDQDRARRERERDRQARERMTTASAVPPLAEARATAATTSTAGKLLARRPMVMDSEGYARRSEPALSKAEVDSHEQRLGRRSVPSGASGRVADDLAWALESIKQSESRSSSSSSASSSSAVGIVARSLTPPLEMDADGAPRATPQRPTAYQLQRAHTADVVQRPDAQASGDITMLRQQVTLLRRSLEEEKKRRAMEQKLMQDKILELQGLIRHNMPEQKRELERNLNAMRTSPPSKQQQQQQQQQQQSAPSQQSTVSDAACPTRSPVQQQATPLPARVRALRNSKQLQKAQVRSPYKTMKLLSELRPEQMDLADGTDDEQDEVEEVDEDELDGQQDEDGETKERRDEGGDAAAKQQSADESEAVRAVEERMNQQLTKLRARMRTLVLEAQTEAKTLKLRLEEDHKIYERKERQLRMEASLRVTSLEERHNYAKKKLLAKTSLLSTQVDMLTDENRRLQEELEARDQRIRQLELALGGRRITMESSQSQSNNSTEQRC